MLIINKHFNLGCFTALAYTTLDRLCAVFLYNICSFNSFLVEDVRQISSPDSSANRWVLHRLKIKICKLRALVGLDIIAYYYVPDIRLIYTFLFIIIITSRKNSSGFEFWSCVITWPWSSCPPNFAVTNDLGFSSHVNLEHSVILIVWCSSSISNLV